MAQFRKILYVITQSELGGAQRYVHDLAVALNQLGHECICAAGEDGPLLANLRNQGIKTHVLKHLKREISPLHDLLALFELRTFIKTIHPDIVHLNSSKAGVIGSLAGRLAKVKKIIYTAHGFVFLEPLPPRQKALYRLAEKITARLKDHIICVSETDRQAALKLKIAPAEKMTTIHNGINVNDLQYLERPEARNEISRLTRLNMSPETMLLGTIANFYPTKGLGYLLSAVAELKKDHPLVRCVIIGDGPDRALLEKLILQHQLKDKVYLTGQVPNAPRLLKAFDLYVSPSVKEGFPYSLLEAMSAGLPIVATNVGGVGEMLSVNAGFLVKPQDSKALAEGITKIIRFDQLLKDLGHNAQLTVRKNFTFDVMLNRILGVYEK